MSATTEGLVGRRFGRYALERVLGAGAMGVVVAARDHSLGREVALKLLHDTVLTYPEAEARFQREAQLLAQVTHPNVVQIFEVGRVDGVPFIAMELIRGPSLRSWLKTPRTTAEVQNVLRQAALGLWAAHEHGVVHRDFKLDNVAVGDDGRVRVLDFGLALQEVDAAMNTERGSGPRFPSSSRLTATGTIMGTPAYMAPEQHVGGRATPRSDQFAFCLALFEALYGNRPFPGKRAEAVLRLITDRQIAAPLRPRRVSAVLRRAMRRGLEPFPDARWPDMRPIIAALGAREDRRRRTWLLGIVPAAAAIVVGWPDSPSSGSEPCAEGLANHPWTAEKRADVRSRFEASPLPFAAQSWARVEASLDTRASDWTKAVEAACATDDPRAVACLLDDSSRTAAVIAALQGDGAGSIVSATRSVTELRSPSDCVDALAGPPLPPVPHDPDLASSARAIRSRLDRVRALGNAMEFDAAVEEAEAGVAAAEALAYPPVVADAYAALGRVRVAMHEPTIAAEAYTTAYYAALEGGHDRAAVNAATQLAFIRTAFDSDLEEAKKWLAAADAGLRRLPTDDELHAWHLHALARAARVSGRHDEALVARRDAAARVEAIHGRVSAPLAVVLNELGLDLAAMGDNDGAREALLRSEDIVAEVYGRDHPEIATTAANLCRLDVDTGELDDAEAHCRRGMEVLRAAYGSDDDRTLRLTFMLQSVLQYQSKLDESESLMRTAVEHLEKRHGPEHPEVAHAFAALASLLTDKGEHEEAEALFWRAIERLREHAPRSRELAVTLVNGAGLLSELGRRAEAVRLVNEAREILESTFGPDHPIMRITLLSLGGYALADGRHDEARALLERAHEIGVLELGEHHPDLAPTHCALGKVARAQADFPQAYSHFERAVELAERSAGPDHPELACALSGWGAALVEEHLYADARPLLERALLLGDDERMYPWYEIDAREALAAVLWSIRSERARAVEVAREARALCRDGPDFAETADRLDHWLARHSAT